MSDRESYAITAAVWLGSLVVVGAPAAAVVSSGLSTLLELLPVDPGGAGAVLAPVVGLAVGLATATEVARVRLHGWAELRRGSPVASLLRHALLAIPALTLLAGFSYAVASEALASYEQNGALTLATLAAIAVLLGLTAVLSIRAFRRGRAEAADPRPARE